jgi:chaperonin GroES
LTIYPQNDRLLVERDETEKRTRGGIILPDGSTKERPLRGVVKAIGPGKTIPSPLSPTGLATIPIGINIGDHVIFQKYAGDSYIFGGKELFLVKAEDIVAVVVGHDAEPEEEDGPQCSVWPGENVLVSHNGDWHE